MSELEEKVKKSIERLKLYEPEDGFLWWMEMLPEDKRAEVLLDDG